jgi:nucleotide-binding universal stress UspA family protein
MVENTVGGRVVVGLDGSVGSRAALDWACAEALRLARGLTIVHVWHLPVAVGPYVHPSPETFEDGAEQVVHQAADRARAALPRGWDIRTKTWMGRPTDFLVAESEGAAVVVVGSRGRGGIQGVLLGSVSSELAARSSTPVVVVRAAGDPAGPVVVGVDQQGSSGAAIAYAFDAASHRHVELVAVTAWDAPEVPDVLEVIDQPAYEKDVGMGLSEALAGMREKYPDVVVTENVIHGHPVGVLRDAAAGASLLVVGSRGRRLLGALLLGSVSQGVLHHAYCPVAVVHPS